MKKVMAFGTFDLFHKGHSFYLKEARKKGDRLYVVVSRDSVVKHIKGRFPLNNEKKRLKRIKSLKFVHDAKLGSRTDMLLPIIKIKPDILCLGYDQKAFTKGLRKELRKKGLHVKIERIKSFWPKIYKSSIIRRKGKKND